MVQKLNTKKYKGQVSQAHRTQVRQTTGGRGGGGGDDQDENGGGLAEDDHPVSLHHPITQ